MDSSAGISWQEVLEVGQSHLWLDVKLLSGSFWGSFFVSWCLCEWFPPVSCFSAPSFSSSLSCLGLAAGRRTDVGSLLLASVPLPAGHAHCCFGFPLVFFFFFFCFVCLFVLGFFGICYQLCMLFSLLHQEVRYMDRWVLSFILLTGTNCSAQNNFL